MTWTRDAQVVVSGSYTPAEVLRITGIDWRTLDHACRAGYLAGPEGRRPFTVLEVDTIHAAKALLDAEFTPAAAFRIAAALAEHGSFSLRLGDIYHLSIVCTTEEPS